MTISIATTERFLNEMLGLPKNVSQRIPTLIRQLQNQTFSSSTGGGIVKLRDYKNCYRIYVGKDHRLIYSNQNNWITLLSVCDRKDCYKNIPDPIFQDESVGSINSNFDELKTDNAEEENKFKITEEKLDNWGIPKEYQPSFINLKKIEDEILYIENVPHKFINRVLDILFPTKLDINSQAELVINSDTLESDLDKIISGEITEFLLKLSDKQKQIAELDSESAILVKGSPGTGKSTLALYRVKHLVDKGVKDILFTTYTDSLTNYSKQLLTSLLGKDPEQSGVRIKTVDQIAKEYFQDKYQKVTELNSEQGIEFLNAVIHTLTESDKRLALRFGSSYILEEINLIIEARNIQDLSRYKNENRYGRKFSLNENQKKSIWHIYERWSDALKASGYISIGKMRQEALNIVEVSGEKFYDAVIIDEAQDLSPVALTLLAKIVKSPKGLYLTADTSQSLYQRGFAWNFILPIVGTPSIKCLSTSYRSTESISKACIQIAKDNADADRDTLTFTMSSIKGEKPRIILSDSWLIEPIKIEKFLRESAMKYRLSIYSSSILCPDKNLCQIVANQLNNIGLRAEYMRKGEIDITKPCIKVLTLYSAKGLEFPFVVLVGLQEGHLPNLDGILDDEKDEILKQQRRLFYVGCSRAMRTLMLYGSKSKISQFVTPLLTNQYWIN